uniref:Uncharacterized protein n=1 Tax=Nymphaea colorata TaxID=210225 RepID=A0A5K1F3G3_9MAGN|nr:unnamed protein product [Nymphaea colorata]
MPRFDPWNVFLKREWNRNWPFLVGFAITGALVTKLTASLTGLLYQFLPSPYLFPYNDSRVAIFILIPALVFAEEDAKNSPFVQRHRRFVFILTV